MLRNKQYLLIVEALVSILLLIPKGDMCQYLVVVFSCRKPLLRLTLMFSLHFSPISLSLPPHSVTVCRFASTGDDWFVLVGVARDMILNPRSVAGGFIYTYRLSSAGDKLEFMHKVGTDPCVFTIHLQMIQCYLIKRLSYQCLVLDRFI